MDRRIRSYTVITEPGKADIECDAFSCGHCQFIVRVKAKQDPSEMGGFCRTCMKHICPNCESTGECKPFEKKLLELESRDRFLRSVCG